MFNDKRISIDFIFLGTSYPAFVRPSDTINRIIQKTILHKPVRAPKLDARLKSGHMLDTDKSFKENNITGRTQIYISEKAGFGG